MSLEVKRLIQYGISLVLAVVLLWYVFRIVHPAALLERFREADYRWILLSMALSVVAYVSRA